MDTEACEKWCKVAAMFFLGFPKSPLCFPISSPRRNKFISAAATSVGRVNEQHPTLPLPARRISPGPSGAFLRRLHGLPGCSLSFCPPDTTSCPPVDPQICGTDWSALEGEGEGECGDEPGCVGELAPRTNVLGDARPQMWVCSGRCHLQTDVQITC